MNAKRIGIVFAVATGGYNGSTTANLSADLTGNAVNIRQTVATGSWQAVSIGNLTAIERLALKNEDATNKVQIALDNLGAKIFAELLAGEPCYTRFPAGVTAIYAQAFTASCLITGTACEI